MICTCSAGGGGHGCCTACYGLFPLLLSVSNRSLCVFPLFAQARKRRLPYTLPLPPVLQFDVLVFLQLRLCLAGSDGDQRTTLQARAVINLPSLGALGAPRCLSVGLEGGVRMCSLRCDVQTPIMCAHKPSH